MSFIRSLDEKQIADLQDGTNIKLYEMLKAEILLGSVFPAIRKNQIYFYYKGGCLYKFTTGKIKRDSNYKKYTSPTTDLNEYETAKKTE